MTRIETVAIVQRNPRILLGMKKKRFGKGKYNGFGGGVKKGEKETEAVIRECEEEVNIEIINPEKMGEILFKFQSQEQNHLVYFFRARRYLGTPKESEEMIPQWFNINKIPYNQMWEDDKYWLPKLLNGQKFKGDFLFNANNKIVKFNLEDITNL
ncbi:MAG: 8-oxo-dGTP diphosphatase [Nanoarchaeota archaeon]